MTRPINTVLIIEDQACDIVGPYLLSHHLGLSATLSFDGADALDRLYRGGYDLVILDWNMPFISGAELLQCLESGNLVDSAADPVPIVLHSGQDLNIGDFEKAVHYKIVDVWKKPIGPVDILKRIKFLNENIRRTG